MSRKNEKARMILPNGQKYITVLDFEVGKVFQYKVSKMAIETANQDYEEYLTNEGHNLGNCEWMIHDSNKLITNYMQVVTN